MKKILQVGDDAWTPSFHPNMNQKILCSICNGKLEITLILGNGEQVILPCGYCGKGNMDIPTGYETIHDAVSKVNHIIIDGVNIETFKNTQKIEYLVGKPNHHTVFSAENVFETKEEALQRAEELKNKWIEDMQKREDYIKADVKKDFSWNAGYHLKEIKRLEKDIEYHKSKAKLCKEAAEKEK